jgi:DNA-binding LacI/PurR family transcriptional regulator
MVYVDIDNFYGGSLVMEHLVALGHKRIAYIGKPSLISSIERMNSHQAVLQKYGLPYDPSLVLITNTSSIEDGYETTLQLLRHPNRPTAIFLANDIMAIGAIQAIRKAGLKVPEDISVAGFDDISLASYSNPPLTTVRQPAFEKGVMATRLLIQSLEKQEIPSSKILEVELVVRGSTGIAPQ